MIEDITNYVKQDKNSNEVIRGHLKVMKAKSSDEDVLREIKSMEEIVDISLSRGKLVLMSLKKDLDAYLDTYSMEYIMFSEVVKDGMLMFKRLKNGYVVYKTNKNGDVTYSKPYIQLVMALNGFVEVYTGRLK